MQLNGSRGLARCPATPSGSVSPQQPATAMRPAWARGRSTPPFQHSLVEAVSQHLGYTLRRIAAAQDGLGAAACRRRLCCCRGVPSARLCCCRAAGAPQRFPGFAQTAGEPPQPPGRAQAAAEHSPRRCHAAWRLLWLTGSLPAAGSSRKGDGCASSKPDPRRNWLQGTAGAGLEVAMLSH